MQYKALATLFLAATALAAPATEGSGDFDSSDIDVLSNIPNSILTVLATAVPQSWYADLLDDSSRSSIISAAEAGTYPAWYNSLPSSVKAWATDYDNQLFGSSTVDSSATGTTSGSSSVVETGSSTSSRTTSSGSSTTASQTSTTAIETSSSSTSTTASSSPSSTESTGGAPAATGHFAMGVAGAAGVLALALAL